MATLLRTSLIRQAIKPRVVLWLASVSVLATLVTLLSVAIKNDPFPSQDRTVLDWVAGWDFPGLTGFFEAVSFLTNNYPAMVLGLAVISFLWLLGLTRETVAFAVIGGIVGLVATVGDYTLGEVVGRSRPLEEISGPSFPSGHVYGTTVIFGMGGFLAVYYRLNRKLLVPLLAMIVTFILLVGAARIYLQVHWPSDVAAGYLLGLFWLLLLVPFFFYIQRAAWFSSPKQTVDLSTIGCETRRIEKSIASTVVLDPERGTATKTYNPPGVVRLLYWLAFQARFPYDHNFAALQAAVYRRKIASALTTHRFGKDLVAHVTASDCGYGECTFVTEFIPGEKVENDEQTKEFLGQVVEIFSEAGLSVWQINPRNPHAHTNVIRNLKGDPIIIDLESAIVTPIPAPGQWRSTLRRGSIPIFDDIDFERLRSYIAANEVALETSLGPDGLAEFKEDVERGEEAMHSWQDSEPRVWGRVISDVYRLLDWKGFFQRLSHKLKSADRVAENFLNRGIERWEVEGRLSSSESGQLRSQVASGETQNALHHLGIHLVLSAALAVPIPGLRSLARFTWTAMFWLKAQARRLLRRAPKTAEKVSNIHSPLVMVIALAPMLGGVAYVAARPLRRKILIRLMLDQIAIKLPFKLYARLNLARRLAPNPAEPEQSAVTPS